MYDKQVINMVKRMIGTIETVSDKTTQKVSDKTNSKPLADHLRLVLCSRSRSANSIFYDDEMTFPFKNIKK